MRTSFHHQPEAQHPIFQLSTSWQADYPIFRREADHPGGLGIDDQLELRGLYDWKVRRLRALEDAVARTDPMTVAPAG